MAKTRIKFECSSCGSLYPKWAGKCNACGEWDTLVEKIETESTIPHRTGKVAFGESVPVPLIAAATSEKNNEPERFGTGLKELDTILGGEGFVEGSLVLIGGDPGIGKSTLMLQAAARVAASGKSVVYLTGEESAGQIAMRAARLGISADDRLLLLTETCFEKIDNAISDNPPDLLIVDSIQTIYIADLGGIPGSLSQVRESSAGFMRMAKRGGSTVVLVGHVTKEGSIAGPRVLEHMVDTVLYFEGDGQQNYRILRVVKNRFGSTNEIGLFEMSGEGLREVGDLSAFFLSGREEETPGSAVICTMEGSRPLLVEAQALATPTGYGNAQRVATGYDGKRASLMLAILEKRLGLPFSSQDVFINMAGGFRSGEPAVDLGVCVSLVSSLRDRTVDQGTVFIGEVGLAGEVRSVDRLERRLAECAKLGFSQVICPAANLDKIKKPKNIKVIGCRNLIEAMTAALGKDKK